MEDTDISAQLQCMENRPKEIKDAFYQDLSFGTGGLRGVIGAGTNRMNLYTVRRISQGLAEYVNNNLPERNRKVTVLYDYRINSLLFAQAAAGVFAANGIQVHIYRELMPTPCLSFAVRQLHCSAGVMITSSHNPAQYNGYKAYGADKCQITTETAERNMSEIKKVDVFDGVHSMDFNQGMTLWHIQYINKTVISAFIKAVKGQSMLKPDCKIRRDFSTVYSPLNGTGRMPVTRVLSECGFSNVHLVTEQEHPDGSFPTCSYPNPEVEQAMELGLEYARKINGHAC